MDLQISPTNIAPQPTVWLTANEAALHLKIKPRTLLLWVRQGKIPAFALSGNKKHVWRFRQSDLDAALLSNGIGIHR
jgi:excisionase family DNA binding protein